MQPPFDIAADLDTPVSAYLKLKPFKPRFLLESVEGGERLARYSFIGFGDCLEVRLDERGLTIDGRLSPPPQTQAELLSAFRSALAEDPESLGDEEAAGDADPVPAAKKNLRRSPSPPAGQL